ncbi:hypothetical protein MFIFM68171_07092 [Madurella fahalii]|uniref:Uncharacterized protein n=1 Tax=Madurella fahalii TaxID=1157608 RepID=A0ABQ0GGI1_9PEZI
MPNHPKDDLLATRNAWILEDAHIHRVTHVESAYPGQDRRAPAPALNAKTPASDRLDCGLTSHEEAAINAAILASCDQERRHRAMLEQRRLEAEHLESARLAEEALESERDAALRRAQALEESLCKTRRERALAEHAAKEDAVRKAEIWIEIQKQKEREREMEKKIAALREKEAKTLRGLEEVAVARAVKDSIQIETARMIAEQKEKMRILREREREAYKCQAERLKQLQRAAGKGMEGQERDGFGDVVGGLGWNFSSSQRRLVNAQTFVENGWKTTGALCTTATSGPRKEAGRNGTAQQTPGRSRRNGIDSPGLGEFPPKTGIHLRDVGLDTDTHLFRRWDRGVDLNRLGEDEAAVWRDEREDGRHWSGATTERWETIIRQEGDGQDGCRRYREVARFGRRFI